MIRSASLVLASLAALASPVAAQGGPLVQEVMDGEGCTLYEVDGRAVTGPYLRPEALGATRRTGAVTRTTTAAAATITVDYSTSFTSQAQAAFQRAVDIWAAHLTSPVEIRVEADFGPLGANTLGSAGPRLVRLQNSLGERTWYPFALADLLLGRDLFPDVGDNYYDITATFSSTFTNFYFGLDGNPPPNEFDFVTIVLHELGHGLGFVGSGRVDDGAGTGAEVECTGTFGVGCYGFTASSITSPLIYDRFLESGAGTSVTNATTFPNPGPDLGTLFQSMDLFVDATETVRIYGERPPIYAPVSFESGSSYSHWDEVTIRNSSAALMTPQVSQGEAYQDPGNITCAFMKDMGWALGSACELLTTGTEVGPNDDALSLSLAGPNPVRGSTSLRVRQSEPGSLTVELYDVLGRRLATLLDGAVGTAAIVAVDAGRLAPGVYRVLARGSHGSRALSVTVVR